MEQLIQYAPTTDKVFEIPLLIVRPWINKFYILDLNPKKSFVRWATEQGFTVFVVSWVNPDEKHGHKTFADYMRHGFLAAVDQVQTATGAEISILPDDTFGQIYRVTRANTTNIHDTTQNYVSFFVQDTWAVGSHLTINPGLRYEHQHLTGTLADLSLGNEWAPRIGATWDPTGQDKMKVYGSWGWFFTRIPNDLAARALSPCASIARSHSVSVPIERLLRLAEPTRNRRSSTIITLECTMVWVVSSPLRTCG